MLDAIRLTPANTALLRAVRHLTGIFFVNSFSVPAFAQSLPALCAFFVIFCPFCLTAQDLHNEETGRIVNASGATIRFRGEAGEYRNDNPSTAALQNAGAIEFFGAQNRFSGRAPLGWNIEARIGGVIVYAKNVSNATQRVQGRYYANLRLEGASVKQVENGVYVGGEDSASGAYSTEGGARLYAGTFHYDSRAAQTILGGEQYQNLEILRGREPKYIASGARVTTRGFFRQDSSNIGGLRVLGALRIGRDGFFPAARREDGTLAGNVVVGAANAPSNTGASFGVGSGTLLLGVGECLALAGALEILGESVVRIEPQSSLRLSSPSPASATFGSLSLPDSGAQLIVEGALRNEYPPLTNVQFHPQSLVVYAGSSGDSSRRQAIMPTAVSHPYGRLALFGADKRIDEIPGQSRGARRMIALAGALRAESLTADMGDDGELYMLNPAASAELAGRAEIRGAMRRVLDDSTREYTFNNAETRFRLESGSPPREMTFVVKPGSPPDFYEPVSDVRRRVSVQSQIEAPSPSRTIWTGAARIGYRAEEIDEPFVPANERFLGIFLASDSSLKRLAALSVTRKSASADSLGFVEYGGLTNQATAPDGVASAETFSPFVLPEIAALSLRGARETMRSRQAGRWSNPTTWENLREPAADDSVEIFHQVHIGFRRFDLDGAQALGQRRERAAASGSVMARSVRIVGATSGANAHGGALFIGALKLGAPLPQNIADNLPNNFPNVFPDEAPPVGNEWRLCSDVLSVESAERPSPDVSHRAPSLNDFLAFRRGVADSSSHGSLLDFSAFLRGGVTIFPESADARGGVPTLYARVGALENMGVVRNGGGLDIRSELRSDGRIANSGALRIHAPKARFAQDSLGGLTAFVAGGGLPVEERQDVPPLVYARLELSGSATKILTADAANGRIPVALESLTIQREAVCESQSDASGIEARGNVVLNGVIRAATSSRGGGFLRLGGAQEQTMTGEGSADALWLNNPEGVQMSGSVLARKEWRLERGRWRFALDSSRPAELRLAELRLADNASIVRFPESFVLGAGATAMGRARLLLQGDKVMTASDELLPRLSTLEVANAGGYRLNKSVRVADTLRIHSWLWTDAASHGSDEYTLTFEPVGVVNPEFTNDSAEIIGSLRRYIPPAGDTLPRWWHNAHTWLQRRVAPDSALIQGAWATLRILPERFPEKDGAGGDSSKIQRLFALRLETDAPADSSLNPVAPLVATAALPLRIGYAWRIAPRDETNDLEAERVVLERWNAAARAWRTNGVPLRSGGARASWNAISSEGFWRFGAMDSADVPARSGEITRFALGVDSLLTPAPTAFFAMTAALEGASASASVFSLPRPKASPLPMRAELAARGLLPLDVDSAFADIPPEAQPRFAPRFFLGRLSLSAIPPDAVDWLLLELIILRDSAAPTRAYLPALLGADGVLRGVARNGAISRSSPPAWELPDSLESGVRAVARLYHRNHLPLEWRDTLWITGGRRFTLDWSDSARTRGALKSLPLPGGGARFFMVAGDATDENHAPHSVERFDYDAASSAAWRRILQSGYERGDADLNGVITTRDLNLIWNNRGKGRKR
jgi:hypothetical protein